MRTIYIFDIEELRNSARQNDLLAGLNLERKEKIAAYRQEEDRVRGLGAGLLLQYSIWKAAKSGGGELSDTQELNGECVWVPVSLDTLEQSADAAAQFCCNLIFAKNAYGKPYLENLPIHFNLSHSGSKVICGISDRTIGVDIQEMREGNIEGIWKRFFDQREKELLEACGTEAQRRELFYRMWAWKEAYGKLTGRGLMVSVSPWLDEKMLGIRCIEYEKIIGYSVVVCYEETIHLSERVQKGIHSGTLI